MSAWAEKAEGLPANVLRMLADANRRHAAIRAAEGKQAAANRYVARARRLEAIATAKEEQE